jgi:hypothetical protein
VKTNTLALSAAPAPVTVTATAVVAGSVILAAAGVDQPGGRVPQAAHVAPQRAGGAGLTENITPRSVTSGQEGSTAEVRHLPYAINAVRQVIVPGRVELTQRSGAVQVITGLPAAVGRQGRIVARLVEQVIEGLPGPAHHQALA